MSSHEVEAGVSPAVAPRDASDAFRAPAAETAAATSRSSRDAPLLTKRRGLARGFTAPVLHFVALGALLFAAHALWAPALHAPPCAPIVLSAEELDRWRREWTVREGLGPAPSPADAQIVDAAIDDAVLLREALAREFDRRDPVVRARLLTLGRYLGLHADGDDALEREARALGLQRSDEVVRRHLVEMMRLAAAKPGPADIPDEAELRQYYAQHQSHFAQPERIGLTHVYLSRDRRGDQLEADAAQLLDRLRQGAIAPEDAAAFGDPFVRGARVPLASATALDHAFGPGFAAALADLPAQTWSGPLRSAYGLHLVWIAARVGATTPPLDLVRNRVLHEYLAEGSEARLHDRLRTWRARYDIRIDG